LLADEIRRVSSEPEADLHELFGRMCFNAAISNLDDHPRNHAVLAKDQGWRLSPAFDLTPTPMIAEDRRDLAMACGHAGRYANRENLLSQHGRFLLSVQEAIAILDHIVEAVRNIWRPTMSRAGVNKADCETIARTFLYDGFFYKLKKKREKAKKKKRKQAKISGKNNRR
jgi:serine/threonine-protein kinase HipA